MNLCYPQSTAGHEPELAGLRLLGPVHVGPVNEGRDLVDLLPRPKVAGVGGGRGGADKLHARLLEFRVEPLKKSF